MARSIIWTSDVDVEQYRLEMEEQYPSITEDQLADFARDMNDNDLECERISLDFDLGHEIICITSDGRWNGRADDYRFLGKNLARCLYCHEDSATWYVDDSGDFRCDGNKKNYLFREWKEGVTGHQMEYVTDQIIQGKVTTAQLNRFTRRIGDRIARVYGWNIH